MSNDLLGEHFQFNVPVCAHWNETQNEITVANFKWRQISVGMWLIGGRETSEQVGQEEFNYRQSNFPMCLFWLHITLTLYSDADFGHSPLAWLPDCTPFQVHCFSSFVTVLFILIHHTHKKHIQAYIYRTTTNNYFSVL